MILQQTIIKVSDNSGAKTAKCIKILGGYKKRFATAGDVIVVVINQLRNRLKKTSKVKKGAIYKALIIRTKNCILSKGHTLTFFNDNAISLMNKQGDPLATRIVGPVSKKVRMKHYKFVGISAGFA
jgi:large subunit ribosomal protein L14